MKRRYLHVAMTRAINEMGLYTKALGAIMRNEAVGGVNPSVVEIALALGTKMIELPTYSSKGHYGIYGDDQKIFPYKKRMKPVYILDERGRLVPEPEEIINRQSEQSKPNFCQGSTKATGVPPSS